MLAFVEADPDDCTTRYIAGSLCLGIYQAGVKRLTGLIIVGSSPKLVRVQAEACRL